MSAVKALALTLLLTAGLPVPWLRAQEGEGSPQTGWADVSEEEIFDSSSFDQAVEESRQEEAENRLEALAGGTFLFDNRLTVGAALDGYTASGGFSGKAFLRLGVPGYGQLYLSYLVRHPLYAAQKATVAFALPGEDLFANSFLLSEFTFSFDVAKVLFFRVGNQLIAWGPAVIWTPVDFINLQRVSPQASIDLRVGKPSLRVHLPLGSANLFLFADLSRTVTAKASGFLVNDLASATNLGMRGDLTALGFEFGLTAYLGMEIQGRYGFDFSGRLLGADIYGELAMAFAYGAYDFAYDFSLGFQRSFGELGRWALQGEIFYHSSGLTEPGAYPALVAAGAFDPFYVGRVYAFGSLSRQELVGSFLDASLSGFVNVSDLSYALTVKAAFDIPQVAPFSLSLSYNGGGEGKAFTLYTGNNAFTGALEVSFSF